jgi:homoserine dehydrogenase
MIDCSATAATTPLLRAWLGKGGGIVLANKKGVSGPMDDFADMTSVANGPRTRYESAVGAGTPFVSTVSRCVQAGDKVTAIEGCFSGTLGFITAGLQVSVDEQVARTRARSLSTTPLSLSLSRPDHRMHAHVSVRALSLVLWLVEIR